MRRCSESDDGEQEDEGRLFQLERVELDRTVLAEWHFAGLKPIYGGVWISPKR